MDISKLMFRDDLMEGERILITGGGTGLGREMAEAFLKLGAAVHICGRRQGKLDDTASELMQRHGGTVHGHACNIRDPDAIHSMVDTIWSHGPLTGVVNNAAGNFISRSEDLSVGGFNAISDIVFRGSFYVTLDIGKRLIAEGRRASFLSILTTWIWNGGPFVVPSAMSKAGLNAMTQSLAVEWGRHGLRFNAIAPGPIDTEANRTTTPQEMVADIVKGIPLSRMGETDDLVGMCLFLLSDQAKWVTGQIFNVDGGQIIR